MKPIQNSNPEVSSSPQTPNHLSPWSIILLLFFFPPLAWYCMWKNPRYHSWFPILLIILGLLSLSTSFLIAFVVYPQIRILTESLNMKQSFWTEYAAYGAVLVGLLEITFGIYVFQRVNANATLSKSLLTISVLILSAYYILGPIVAVFSALSVITPIYTLTNAVGTNPDSLTPTPQNPPKVEETFCTLDAKICPDGSSVGRSGPSCEFAPCPNE